MFAAALSRGRGAKERRIGGSRRQLDGAAVGGAGPRGMDEGMVQILQIAAAAALIILIVVVQTRTERTSLLLLLLIHVVFDVGVDIANGRS